MADYANRLGPLYHSIARSRADDGPWDAALIGRVEEDRRHTLSEADLGKRREWRDERLMEFALQRRKAAED